ncbi:hypothetical protein AOLI_G00264690 [Acnodon oligacanthus]
MVHSPTTATSFAVSFPLLSSGHSSADSSKPLHMRDPAQPPPRPLLSQASSGP